MNVEYHYNTIEDNCMFDYNDEVDVPENITQLSFADDFNKSLEDILSEIKAPKNITTLFFGYSFNQPIDSLIEFSNLRELKFDDYFNQPINVLAKLEFLEILFFGNYFNQSIDNLSKLQNLHKIYLGHYFDQLINEIPPNLTTLKFTILYDKVLFNALESPIPNETCSYRYTRGQYTGYYCGNSITNGVLFCRTC